MTRLPRPTRPLPTTTPSSAAKHTNRNDRPAGTVRAGRSSLGTAFVALTLVLMGCGSTDQDSEPSPTDGGVAETVVVDVQGHRGARGLRPENTLPAFELALDLGVTTLELDLHYSADGQVVVWHDPIIDPDKCRLGPNAPSGLPDPESASSDELAVRNLTADQLAGYQCDTNPDPSRFPDQEPTAGDLSGDRYHIVTLTELFAFVAEYAESDQKTAEQRQTAAEVLFNIETKRVPSEPENIGDGFDGETAGPFEIAVMEATAAAGIEDRVIVQSFDHRSLRAIAASGSDLALAPLTRDRVRNPGQYTEWGATIWSPRASTLTEDAVEAAHEAGLLVIPWTVNEISEMEELIAIGVDGIITDRPDLLLNR